MFAEIIDIFLNFHSKIIEIDLFLVRNFLVLLRSEVLVTLAQLATASGTSDE